MTDEGPGAPLADRPGPRTSPAVIALTPNPALIDQRVRVRLVGSTRTRP